MPILEVKDKTKIVYERPCGNSDCNGMIASNKNLLKID